jgi:hypothetical protein
MILEGLGPNTNWQIKIQFKKKTTIKCSSTLKAGLRIRIDLMRIRIRNPVGKSPSLLA